MLLSKSCGMDDISHTDTFQDPQRFPAAADGSRRIWVIRLVETSQAIKSISDFNRLSDEGAKPCVSVTSALALQRQGPVAGFSPPVKKHTTHVAYSMAHLHLLEKVNKEKKRKRTGLSRASPSRLFFEFFFLFPSSFLEGQPTAEECVITRKRSNKRSAVVRADADKRCSSIVRD